MARYFNILQLTMAIFYPIAVASAAEAAVSVKRIEVRLIYQTKKVESKVKRSTLYQSIIACVI